MFRKNALRLKRGGFETRSRQRREVVAVTTASGFNAEIVRNRPLSSIILGGQSLVYQSKTKNLNSAKTVNSTRTVAAVIINAVLILFSVFTFLSGFP